jgi:WD40 repeat protein
MKEPSIEITRQLKGHTDAINSLDVQTFSSTALLLSGSEDGTARIWDIRSSESSTGTSQACCTAQGPVTAVAWDTHDDTAYFIATEKVLSWYDLRMQRSIQIFESMDEINQIIVASPSCNRLSLERKQKKHNKKNKKAGAVDTNIIPTMACADDTGQVNLWRHRNRPGNIIADDSGTIPSFQQCQLLQHNADTLVLSCALDEHDKYFVTGTSDCCVRIWSWTTGQLLSQSNVIAMQQEQSQLCNPPMIHSLTRMPSFPCFVAGCGDGSLAIGNTQGVWLSRVDLAHGAAVAACCPFATKEWGCLASTGNDGRIVLWDMQSLLWSSKTTNGNDRTQSTSCREWLFGNDRTSSSMHDKNLLQLNDAMESWSLQQEPQTLLAWDHGKKPNDMVHDASETALVLADTSPIITMYTIRPGS